MADINGRFSDGRDEWRRPRRCLNMSGWMISGVCSELGTQYFPMIHPYLEGRSPNVRHGHDSIGLELNWN